LFLRIWRERAYRTALVNSQCALSLLVSASHPINDHFGPDCDLNRHGLFLPDHGDSGAKKKWWWLS